MGAPLDSKSNQPTLVTFLLDRSGSMASCIKSTIEAFNGYIGGLRADAQSAINFTLITFDSTHSDKCQLDKVVFETPVAAVKDLSYETYQPRGGTPLIEAAIKTINALTKAVDGKTDKPKIVVCIQTDGEENSSGREYTWDGLKALIAEKQKLGWQFNFMGAGIDAYDQGAKMGISAAATMSYDSTSPEATKSAFRASAQNTAMWAGGLRSNTSYSLDQKLAAGDTFDPALTNMAKMPKPPKVKRGPQMDIDLSGPDAAVTSQKRDELVL